MPPIFTELPHTLGIYTLTRLLESGKKTDLYLARQNLVNREVILEVLRPDSPQEVVSDFLESGRLRVSAADMPHVAQVLESLQEDGVWFMTHEKPQGYSYLDIVAAKQHISPHHCCRIIAQAADIYTYCKRRGLDSINISPAMLFLSPDGGTDFLSPVTAAGRGTDIAAQMSALSRVLAPTRPLNVSGSTRCASLLRWMQKDAAAESYDWASIGTTASTVITQLNESEPPLEMPVPPQSEAAKRRQRRNLRRKILYWARVGGIAAAIVAAIASLGVWLTPSEVVRPIPTEHDGMVFCKQGAQKFAVSGTYVSIAQYERFLKNLDRMEPTQLEHVHMGIPSEYRNHVPDDWETQLEAARNRSSYNGRSLRMDSPVTGVSYWDALAYAKAVDAEIVAATTLQKVRESGGAADLQEWSSSQTPRDMDLLYKNRSQLILDSGDSPRVIPVKSPAVRSNTLGFRIATPQA